MTDPATPVATLTPSRWSRVWSFIRRSAATVRLFATQLIDRSNPAVDLQLLAFCFLFPVSVYWLWTRPHLETGWVACFSTLWGAVALKDIIQRRPGSDQG